MLSTGKKLQYRYYTAADAAPVRSRAGVGILVDREKAVISGPKAAIATAIAAQTLNGEVRSFVREWRGGQSGEDLLPVGSAIARNVADLAEIARKEAAPRPKH